MGSLKEFFEFKEKQNEYSQETNRRKNERRGIKTQTPFEDRSWVYVHPLLNTAFRKYFGPTLISISILLSLVFFLGILFGLQSSDIGPFPISLVVVITFGVFAGLFLGGSTSYFIFTFADVIRLQRSGLIAEQKDVKRYFPGITLLIVFPLAILFIAMVYYDFDLLPYYLGIYFICLIFGLHVISYFIWIKIAYQIYFQELLDELADVTSLLVSKDLEVDFYQKIKVQINYLHAKAIPRIISKKQFSDLLEAEEIYRNSVKAK